MRLFKPLLILLCFSVISCSNNIVEDDPDDPGVARLAKSHIGEILELSQLAIMDDLKILMLKLYRRNPAERHDKDERTIEASVDLFFSHSYDYGYAHWQVMSPTDVIRIALDETYQGGDRVLPFIFGLRKMLMASYDYHTDFYYFTSIDEQKLYNSARNIEIAAWMLGNKRDLQGELLLLSDSLENEQRNLSFQRLIGEMIATQDNMAEIISHELDRGIKTVIVSGASMVFFPI
ncbi:MAG: hypothetical protein DRQ46_03625 [Gammaproteobacteria bacterium]|nr:MAG: hypothetical protein DRQ46_03625 [Gammaproteobacteria bacterium]